MTLVGTLLSFIFLLLAGVSIYVYVSGRVPPEANAVIDRVIDSNLPEVIVGQTGFATSDGLRIWYESISPEAASKGTILLIMAMGGNALDWPPKFVRELVDSGYQVIRYDNRGTGLSDWVENWDRKKPYSIADMANDAHAVLDALNIQKAHVLGLSMGGMIAQEMAIRDPDRVASLTLIMTSGYVGDPAIPGITSGYFLHSLARGLPLLKYRIGGGEKNLVRERIAKMLMAMGEENVDFKEVAEVALYDLRHRRGINIKAIFQHQTAVTLAGSRYEKLKAVTMPTLVIHGTADQFIPVEHGKKLVEVIPNARGMWLEGAGHMFPLPNMREVMKNIMAHLDNKQKG
jgi:pimeloyl-ACP methyl ester carboxylesterase